MNRRERLEMMGDKMKKFNNVYIKNFGEEIDDEKLREIFEAYGKIISAKVLIGFIFELGYSISCKTPVKMHIWFRHIFISQSIQEYKHYAVRIHK